MLASDPVALEDSLVLYLLFGVLDDSSLVHPRSQLIGQELVATQPIETEQFVLHDSIDEEDKSREGPDVEFLHKEGCLFCLDGEELGLGELLAEDTEMFMHDRASLELLVEEVNDGVLEFGDIVQELILRDLSMDSLVPLCTRRRSGSLRDD